MTGMFSKGSAAYNEVRAASFELLNGIALVVDPSIGSESSMPGWAVYERGVLRDSGVIEIDSKESTPHRLQRLNFGIRRLVQIWNPDVMVYEAITDVPFKGYSGRGHAPLLKALGAILSISGPTKHVGILAASWRRLARDTYEKGTVRGEADQNDAIEIGWVAISQAALISEKDPISPRRKKKAS